MPYDENNVVLKMRTVNGLQPYCKISGMFNILSLKSTKKVLEKYQLPEENCYGEFVTVHSATFKSCTVMVTK